MLQTEASNASNTTAALRGISRGGVLDNSRRVGWTMSRASFLAT